MKIKNKALISTAILGVLFASHQSFAKKKNMNPKASKATKVNEMNYKCKGVATKWVNDCGGGTGANRHSCAGHALVNFDKSEWLRMSKKDCHDVQMALKNPAIKAYVEKIRNGTEAAMRRGKGKKMGKIKKSKG